MDVAKRKSRRGGRRPADTPRPVPRMRRHATGQAFARWREAGRERCVYFGGWGTPAAKDAYRRWAARWIDAGPPQSTPASPGTIVVAEVLSRWLDWCQREYVKFGRPTTAAKQCRLAASLLNAAHGDRPAAEFAPHQLADLQREWAARYSRETVRIYRGCVIRAFRWGAGAGLIPAAIGAALREVPHLRPGRSAAAEPVKREAVAWDVVERTLPHLAPAVAAAVVFHWHTGCRPGEVASLRPCDLAEADGITTYTVRPEADKNYHRGRVQTYIVGPRARAAIAAHLAGCAADRPVFGVTTRGYQERIKRACGASGEKWTAHQLRHAHATAAARHAGSFEAAAAVLGDSVAVAKRYTHCDPLHALKVRLAEALG